jgi:hypothetical protein
MLTVICAFLVAGQAKPQSIQFDFSLAEASKFLHGYGQMEDVSLIKLNHLACQDIEETLNFLDGGWE